MALLLGVFIMWGVQPGPMLIPKHPEIFWPLVASMYMGNIMLLILNLPLVPLFAHILDMPRPLLLPVILVFSIIGVYAMDSRMFDVWLLFGFGVLGFFMRLYQFPAAPMIMALVLGPLMENAMRQSLMMSNGNPMVFVTRPVALAIFIVAAIFLALPIIRAWLARGSIDQGMLPPENGGPLPHSLPNPYSSKISSFPNPAKRGTPFGKGKEGGILSREFA